MSTVYTCMGAVKGEYQSHFSYQLLFNLQILFPALILPIENTFPSSSVFRGPAVNRLVLDYALTDGHKQKNRDKAEGNNFHFLLFYSPQQYVPSRA